MFVAPLTLALLLTPAQKAAEVKAQKAAQIIQVQKLQQAVARQRLARPIDLPVPAPQTPATLNNDSSSYIAGGPGDESVLKNAKLAVTDDALLDFFRKRTPPAPDREKLAELVKKLSSKEDKDADAALGTLIAIGEPALPLLRTTANNTDDPAGSKRAKFCMEQIEPTNAAQLVVNAARLLASRKPQGACLALLDYLPFAEDEQTFAEVEAAMVGVAIGKDGKPDAALISALKDKLALRRASAAQVLAQAGGTAYYKEIRPLLKDAKPSVRLRAALGLVGSYDAEAVPVLIDLMGELPGSMRKQAEDYLLNLAGEWAVAGPRGNDATSRRLRREVWLAWWKGVDAAKIIEDIKNRTPSDEDHDKIVKLIARLDDSSSDTRDSALKDLINMGTKASSLLRRATTQEHPRISPLAAKALDAIEKDTPNPLPTVAARVLALRRPEGTAAALLGYLPFAESQEAADQITDILGAIGVKNNKGDEALVKALEDKIPARRAAAAMALCKGRATGDAVAIRKLYRDKDPLVKLRAAQGMALMGEKKAIPVLITLLADLPLDLCWEVEDYLTKVAGSDAPALVVSEDKDSRTKAVEAWANWWTKVDTKKLDLTKIDPNERELGFLLLVENYNRFKGNGRVVEMDRSGKVRWSVENLSGPYDAQVLRNGNILVVEQMNRVTERDRTGKVVGLDKYYSSVFHVERLRGGNTFVACRNQILLVDAKGNNTLTHYYNNNSIIAARTFRDGTIGYISYSGHYVRIDKTGKQLKTFQLPWSGYSINGAQILPNERVIVSVSNYNKVKEYTPDGKVAWEASVTYPLTPFRLSNGHTIVPANSSTAIVEIDRNGKVVKTTAMKDMTPYRIKMR